MRQASQSIQITSNKAVHLSPKWSPDGRYVTFTSYEDKNPDLFIFEVATGKKRKLSGSPGINSGGARSPDGDLIAFTGSKEGDSDIFTIKPEGGERQMFIKGQGLDVDPAFSPNKKWLAYVSGRYGNPHIFVADLDWSYTEILCCLRHVLSTLSVALRFPRILRWRKDKPIAEADTLDNLKQFLSH